MLSHARKLICRKPTLLQTDSRRATIGPAPDAARLCAPRRRGFAAAHRSRKYRRYRFARLRFFTAATGIWAASLNGNALRFDHDHGMILQSHREAALGYRRRCCGKLELRQSRARTGAITPSARLKTGICMTTIWKSAMSAGPLASIAICQPGAAMPKNRCLRSGAATDGEATAAALHAIHNADNLCEARRAADEKWLSKGS